MLQKSPPPKKIVAGLFVPGQFVTIPKNKCKMSDVHGDLVKIKVRCTVFYNSISLS